MKQGDRINWIKFYLYFNEKLRVYSAIQLVANDDFLEEYSLVTGIKSIQTLRKDLNRAVNDLILVRSIEGQRYHEWDNVGRFRNPPKWLHVWSLHKRHILFIEDYRHIYKSFVDKYFNQYSHFLYGENNE